MVVTSSVWWLQTDYADLFSWKRQSLGWGVCVCVCVSLYMTTYSPWLFHYCDDKQHMMQNDAHHRETQLSTHTGHWTLTTSSVCVTHPVYATCSLSLWNRRTGLAPLVLCIASTQWALFVHKMNQRWWFDHHHHYILLLDLLSVWTCFFHKDSHRTSSPKMFLVMFILNDVCNIFKCQIHLDQGIILKSKLLEKQTTIKIHCHWTFCRYVKY